MLPEKKPEFQLIEQFRSHLTHRTDVLVDIGDDAAVVRWSESRLGLITADMLLEGVHFLMPPATPREVGRKVMGVNLSDIAAMAGQPRFAVVSLGLSKRHSSDVALDLFAGMHDIATEFNTQIIGGDTNSWDGPLVINVTLTGEPHPRGPVTRSGAKVGDWIMVTGELGGSILGRQFSFQPRVSEAQQLHELVELHAMLDISDGLVGDLYHILEESHVGAILDAASIPISVAAHNMPDTRTPLEHAMSDGEDFELLFTVSPEDGRRLLDEASLAVRISHIGEIVAEPSCLLRTANGGLQPLPRLGWNHGL